MDIEVENALRERIAKLEKELAAAKTVLPDSWMRDILYLAAQCADNAYHCDEATEIRAWLDQLPGE